jgi:hypothetical protein
MSLAASITVKTTTPDPPLFLKGMGYETEIEFFDKYGNF